MGWPVSRYQHVELADSKLGLLSRVETRLHRPQAADPLKAARDLGLLGQSELRTVQRRRSPGLVDANSEETCFVRH